MTQKGGNEKMKKLLTSVILTTGLLVPTIALASDNNLWSNPNEYYSMPNGTEQSNKSDRLTKGHNYKVSFDAETYGGKRLAFIYPE
jgi:hypothetical protein